MRVQCRLGSSPVRSVRWDAAALEAARLRSLGERVQVLEVAGTSVRVVPSHFFAELGDALLCTPGERRSLGITERPGSPVVAWTAELDGFGVWSRSGRWPWPAVLAELRRLFAHWREAAVSSATSAIERDLAAAAWDRLDVFSENLPWPVLPDPNRAHPPPSITPPPCLPEAHLPESAESRYLELVGFPCPLPIRDRVLRAPGYAGTFPPPSAAPVVGSIELATHALTQRGFGLRVGPSHLHYVRGDQHRLLSCHEPVLPPLGARPMGAHAALRFLLDHADALEGTVFVDAGRFLGL